MADATKVVTCILLGLSGSGKSLLGNRLLNLTEGDDTRLHFTVGDQAFNPQQTVFPQKESIAVPEHDYILQLVDTPGLYRSSKEFICKWIDILHAAEIVNKQVNALIIVISLTDVGFTKCVEAMKHLLGHFPNCGRNILVVFSFCEGKDQDEYLQRFDEELGVSCAGAKYVFVDQKSYGEETEAEYNRIKLYLKDISTFRPLKLNAFRTFCRMNLEFVIKDNTVKSISDLQEMDYINWELILRFNNEQEIKEIIEKFTSFSWWQRFKRWWAG